MITEAIKHIEQNAHGQQIDVCARPYTTRVIHPVKDPMPDPLQLTTLRGVCSFLDTQPIFEPIIHIVSPIRVAVCGLLSGPFRQRPIYAAAEWMPLCFPFGKFLDQEEFIIGLNSRFVPTEQTAAILSYVSGLRENSSQKLRDDGITQTTTIRAGVASLAESAIQNPVTLKPFRTFVEVDQPASQFVFRMRRENDGVPTCALFAADGGMWQVDAMLTIREWFIGRCNVPVVM
jgi:hypothetical protein